MSIELKKIIELSEIDEMEENDTLIIKKRPEKKKKTINKR